MTGFLLFQLYGPMASWGEIAVGEERDTASHPSRSAVLGLCAAALGIRRDEDERLQALNQSLGFAVRVDSHGDLLRDYHTVQSPTGKKARDLPTRRDELNYQSREATLTKRHYRSDACYTVCLWRRSAQGPVSLHELSDALKSPVYALYLGRKSCPLALPLAPKLVEVASLREAFLEAPVDPDLRRRLKVQGTQSIFWDADIGDVKAGMQAMHQSKRWDRVVSREGWQFARRDEAFSRVSAEPPKEVR